MSINTTTLPQNIAPIKTVTLTQVVALLPATLPYPMNFWIGGKIALYGRTAENLLFFVESDVPPTQEMMDYFNSIVAPLGIQATVTQNWKDQRYASIRLYNAGTLIIDPQTMTYIALPTEVASAPVLYIQDFMAKLPKTIKWTQTFYLTGGLVKNGWSCHDADMIVFDIIDDPTLKEVKKFFADLSGWKFDIGKAVMTDREPVYLYKLYENGNLNS